MIELKVKNERDMFEHIPFAFGVAMTELKVIY